MRACAAVLARAQEIGAEYAATLNLKAHLASKVKARQIAIDAIQAGIDGLAAAKEGGLERVTYQSRKSPASWRGSYRKPTRTLLRNKKYF